MKQIINKIPIYQEIPLQYCIMKSEELTSRSTLFEAKRSRSVLFRIDERNSRLWKNFDKAFSEYVNGDIHSWWHHQMETFSALLAICARHSPVSGEFPAQRPVTRSFDVFFDVRLIRRLSKHLRGWWFETLPHPLWRHRNVTINLRSAGNGFLSSDSVGLSWYWPR